jgi:transposase-like protein
MTDSWTDPWPHYSYTGPTPHEVAREAANTGRPIEEIAAELGVFPEVAAAAVKLAELGTLAEPQPAPHLIDSTGPTQMEIAREAAATGKSVEQVAKELGAVAPAPAVKPAAKRGPAAKKSTNRRGRRSIA